METLPALLDELRTDALAAAEKLKAWLAKESDIKSVAKLTKQFSAASESLRKCRDGESITLAMQNEYAAAKLRCQRRGGELLKAMEKHKGGRPTENRSHDETGFSIQDQLGTETESQAKNISSRWQRIADVPQEEFEEMIDVEKQTAAEEEITAASILRKSKAVHVSQNTGQPEWYTPPEYIEAARRVLGGIDLDPASSDKAQETVQATEYLTVAEDGLTHDWTGCVWLNPPYASGVVDKFMLRLKDDYDSGSVKAAITLTNNATETAWFQACCQSAAALCLVSKRVKFLDERGKPGSPLQGQALLYFGRAVAKFTKHFETFGCVWVRP